MACVVAGCNARYDKDYHKGTKFYSIPKACCKWQDSVRRRVERRRHLWLSRLNRPGLTDEKISKNTRVCSRHFISGAPAEHKDETSPDWAPSLHLGHELPDSEKVFRGSVPRTNVNQQSNSADPNDKGPIYFASELDLLGDELSHSTVEVMAVSETDFCGKIAHILFERSSKAITTEPDLNSRDENCDDVQESCVEMKEEHCTVQSDVSGETKKNCNCNCNFCETCEQEINALKKKCSSTVESVNGLQLKLMDSRLEIVELKKMLSTALRRALSLEEFRNDNTMVEFYTGLPNFAVFEVVLNHVLEQFMEISAELPPWKCLLLVLMRLRLCLTIPDLAYRFGVSVDTAYSTFERWLLFLYVALKPLISWPDRGKLCSTMPIAFKKVFKSSAGIIIDCIEIYVDNSAALGTRVMMWSNYKQQPFVKYIIGITPSRAISFISSGFVGILTNKIFAAHCGLFEKLLPGDILMADKEFVIGEDVGFQCAKLTIPPNQKDTQCELSSPNLTEKVAIATLACHVENVVGLVRHRYTILKENMPPEFLIIKPGHDVNQVDEIIHVCCVLTNLSMGSIV